ncbi:MAG TPA: hypothetical protein VGJ21_12585 [Terracidiphilus sp.]|jgi:hypothetical protein
MNPGSAKFAWPGFRVFGYNLHMAQSLLSRVENRFTVFISFLIISALLTPWLARPQQTANEQAIRKIDSAVASREDNLIGYTVTERYRVFRGGDAVHPAAEMTVKTTYRKDAGKSYTILSQTGSGLILNDVLGRVLDSERLMTQPANRVQALLNSANYSMTIKGSAVMDGYNCVEAAIAPKRASPYLFKGSIWIDPLSGSIVKLEGVAGKSPSVLTGPTHVSRHYAILDGFPIATHATAVSSSWLLGETRVEIDYTDYSLTPRIPAQIEQSPPNIAPAARHE